MIQESTPEKRNLLVISILIIIFVCGGAVITPGETNFKLSIFSVELENIGFLVFSVWATLVYCVYRYFVVSTESFKRNYHADIISVMNTKKHLKVVVDLIGGPVSINEDEMRAQKQFANIDLELTDFHRKCIDGSIDASDSLEFRMNSESTRITSVVRKNKEQELVRAYSAIDFVSEGWGFSKPNQLYTYVILVTNKKHVVSGELMRKRSVNFPFSREQNRKILIDLIFKRQSLSDYFLPWVMAFLAFLLLWGKGVQNYPTILLYISCVVIVAMGFSSWLGRKG